MDCCRFMFLALIAIAIDANAVIIETTDGNTYDVQAGGPPSPYVEWLNGRPRTKMTESLEFAELKYRSKIPLNQEDKIRAEAQEVFEKYLKATNNALYNQAREAAEQRRFLNIMLWLGTGNEQIQVRAKKTGAVLEKRITPHHYVAVFNPAGRGFSPMVYPQTAYWLHAEKESKPLGFLKDDRDVTPDAYEYLREMLGVEDSDLWIAFTIKEMRRESVDLRMDVFDADHIVHSKIVKGCIRTDLCDKRTLDSYSVLPSDGNSVITFRTTAGALEYDVKAGTLKTRADIAPVQSKCK